MEVIPTRLLRKISLIGRLEGRKVTMKDHGICYACCGSVNRDLSNLHYYYTRSGWKIGIVKVVVISTKDFKTADRLARLTLQQSFELGH
jgi:hypothetical protein